MKPETLQALLIDRSLGEMPAETAELLDAYLAEHPTAAAEAVCLGQTVALARSASLMPACEEHPLPLPPWRRGPAARLPFASPQWLKLAACIVAGLAVGWLARAPSPSLTSEPPALRPPIADARGDPRPAGAPAAGFWATRTALSPTPERRTGQYRLRWNSLAQRPLVEEKP